MELYQTFTILFALALFAALAFFIIWMVEKIDSKVKNIRNKSREDRVGKIENRLDGHTQRIDQLYETIVDLLKKIPNDARDL